jgi:hypothetical protein
MKDAEDEAFDDLARRQGAWGGGFQAKRRMAADKLGQLLADNNMPDTPTARAVYRKMSERVEDDDIQDYRREWVGLTDEEIQAYWDWEDWQTGAGRSTIFEMVRDIEAKLRSKNNGP